MSHRVLNYRTESDAKGALKRLMKKYPVHADCKVDVVASSHWQYPFRYLIRLTGKDGNVAYWSAAR